jgi:uncharacterized membrane protein YqaE (UPF0057 family)
MGSSNSGNNKSSSGKSVPYGAKYDYSNTPAYRRKLKRDLAMRGKQAAMVANQGPLSVFVIGILDFLLESIVKILEIIWDFAGFGFDAVYGNVYAAGADIIPNAEKFGSMVSMKPFRIFLTILIPPLGILLSKGLYGWFNILICFVLMYINFLLGAVYALVITFRNRYADRYEEAEQKRLTLIKAYVTNCTGETDGSSEEGKELWPLVSSLVFIFGFIGILYWAFNKL